MQQILLDRWMDKERRDSDEHIAVHKAGTAGSR
jgi:hypothetical protein